MIFVFIFNIATYFILIGYSHLFINIFLKKKKIIENLDLVFSIVLLAIFSISINFFIELKKIQNFIYLFGIILFFHCFIKKQFKINLTILLIISFIMSYISFYSLDNIDSPMYHLQILKWKLESKVVFGLSNLEIRFGANSLWHSLVALLDIKFFTFSYKYYLSSLIIIIFIIEVFNKKKYFFDYLFLSLSFFILFFFSLIHPYNNGIILNHLGNPELDIVPMIFFILSIFIFMKFQRTKDKEYFYLYCFCAFFCITSRFIYLPLILPILVQLLNYKKFISFRIYFLGFGSIVWLLNSYVNSGCLIFPYQFTCFDVSWSPGIENIDYHLKEVMSYSRDGPLRLNYKNFDYTLNSYEWIIPWIFNYYIKTSFLVIISFLILISIIFIIFANKKNNLKIYDVSVNRSIPVIFIVLILNLIIWLQAPETRLGVGILLSLAAFTLAYSIILNFKYLVKKMYISFVIVNCIVICSLFYKNFKNHKFKDFISIPDRSHNYSHISKLGKFDGYEIFVSDAWRCADFVGICVNKPKKNYSITHRDSYLVIKSK
jgi:hypothetical protein